MTTEQSAGWIDSHCHLQALANGDRDRQLDEARQAGVRGFLAPATSLADADAVLEIAHRHADVWCALGVHPHEAASWRAGDERRLAALLGDARVVAVGECGLDFHYDRAPREDQAEVLRAQWRLAVELDLPVVVHNRESDATMLDVVREPEFAALRADFHSFAGSREMLAELLGRGFAIGFSGMVTFAKADAIRAHLAGVPDDRILLETDTPYLAPAPHRGQPNRPAWVARVGERVARERGWTIEEAKAVTSANFRRFFPRAVL
jgi:TatD DNase family protein